MSLCVDAGGNGDGAGTHLSLFLHLMKGPHDDELTWPLRGKFEIKLLNHISDSEHHCDTSYDEAADSSAGRVSEGDRSTQGWGEQHYITNEDLYKITPTCQYLKYDRLFF